MSRQTFEGNPSGTRASSTMRGPGVGITVIGESKLGITSRMRSLFS